MNFIAPIGEAELTGIALRNVTARPIQKKTVQKTKPPRAWKDKGLGGKGKTTSLLSTPERRAQSGGVVQELVPVDDPKSRALFKRHRAAAECWLDRYAMATPKRRAVLDEAEYDAGLELRRAWLFLLRGIKWSFDSTERECLQGAGNPTAGHERMEYSDRIVRDMYDARLSAKQKIIIVKVCGYDEAAGTTAEIKTLKRGLASMAEYWRRGRPVRAANQAERTVDLSCGLDKVIAEHLNITPETRRKLALQKSI